MSYISQFSGQIIDETIEKVKDYSPLNSYPIGSLYLSLGTTSPASLFGGTWQKLEDKFIMAAGSENAVGATGGSKTHTHTSAAHTHTTAGHVLTVAEIPSHGHEVRWWKGDFASGAPPKIFRNGKYEDYKSSFNQVSANTTSWISYDSASGKLCFQNGTGDPIGTTDGTGSGASHSHGNTGSTTPGATGATAAPPPILQLIFGKELHKNK